MYNTDAMGVRIGELRRARGLTQQQLADALGISGQAVSKWESGLGYPDITLLPAIADTLGVSIEVLFGREPDAPILPVNAPYTKADTPEPGPTETDAAAQEAESDARETDRTADPDVFSDESIDAAIEAGLLAAEEALRSVPDTVKAAMDEAKEALNTAKRSARHAGMDGMINAGSRIRQDLGRSAAVRQDTASGIRSLDLHSQSGADISVYASEDGVCRWEAMGAQGFVDRISVKTANGCLHLRTPNHREMAPGPEKQNNRVTIWFGAAEGAAAILGVAGSGSIHCRPSFQTAELSVAGSGDISFTEADDLKASIAGSGEIDFDRAETATLQIAGSGDIDGQEVTHSLVALISGSGDIAVTKSSLHSLTAHITGSGDLDIDELDADEAAVKITGSGDVTVDRGRVDALTVMITGSGDLTMSDVTARTADIVLRGASDMTIGAITEPYRLQKEHGSSLCILNRE